MVHREIMLLVVAVVQLSSAWMVAVPHRAAPLARPLRAGCVRAEESWSFGDADEVSTTTAEAIEVEEREMTEKEKEIAALRAAEKFMMKDTGDAKCTTCGYTYRWEEGAPGLPKKTPWELVPESWACPKCKSPRAFFEPVQIEIAGFADNQAYGFGTNTWTEAQKSTAIFGGLAAFFALFIGGYAVRSRAAPTEHPRSHLPCC